MKAIYAGKVIAESSDTIYLEGNHYFPPDSVSKEFLESSDHHTHCPWKGEASYYTVTVNGDSSQNAAWYYPEPFEAASQIKDHVAFWKGVQIQP